MHERIKSKIRSTIMKARTPKQAIRIGIGIEVGVPLILG
jgi:hypothetical protein